MKKVWIAVFVLSALLLVLGANIEPVNAATTDGLAPPAARAAGPDILLNLLSNSSFEVDCCWQFPQTPLTAAYTTAKAKTALRSARTGAITSAQNRYSYSSARQSVRIPGSVTSATLVFYLWQKTTESAQNAIPKPDEFGKTEAAMAGDVQYVLILDQTGKIIAKPYWDRKNTGAWTQYTFDMMAFKGQTVTIQVGTYNDGLGGYTGMYADDVSLYFFTHPAPPSTGLVVNGTFEENLAWEFPLTPLPAAYAEENAYSGYRSARTGAKTANQNRYSYSSVRQSGIVLPTTFSKITLYFSLYQWTTESPLTPIPKRSEFGRTARAMAGDVQYALVLNSNNQVIKYAYWNRKNTKQWTSFTVDVTEFKGQTIKIQFGTYNDGAGGYTGMYVDDVVIFGTTP